MIRKFILRSGKILGWYHALTSLLFVFRVFDHVSYALVMEAARAVQRGDAIRNP